MPKRNMGLIRTPSDLILEMQRNVRSRTSVVQEIRDQCCGSRPRKQAFFESDVVQPLLQVMHESCQEGEKRNDDVAALCMDVLCTLVKAEDSSLPHAEILAAAVPSLFNVVCCESETAGKSVSALRALTSIFERLSEVVGLPDAHSDAREVLKPEVQRKAKLLYRSITVQNVKDMLSVLKSSDLTLTRLVRRFLAHLPQDSHTVPEKLANQFLEQLEKDMDTTSSDFPITIAAIARMVALTSDTNVALGRSASTSVEALQRLIHETQDYEIAIKASEIAQRRIKDSRKLIPNHELRKVKIKDNGSGTAALAIILDLIGLAKREAPLDHRTPLMLDWLLGIFAPFSKSDSRVRDMMADAGLIVLLLKQAEYYITSTKYQGGRRPQLALFSLNLLRVLHRRDVLTKLVPAATNVISPVWTSLLRGLKEKFEALHTSEELAVLYKPIVLFWTLLTTDLRLHSALKDYFEGMCERCLGIAMDVQICGYNRILALELGAHLISLKILPTGQKASAVEQQRSEIAQQLLKVIHQAPYSLESSEIQQSLTTSALSGLINLTNWEWRSSVVWKHIPWEFMVSLLEKDDPSIKEAALRLLVNLSSDETDSDMSGSQRYIDVPYLLRLLPAVSQRERDARDQMLQPLVLRYKFCQRRLYSVLDNLMRGDMRIRGGFPEGRREELKEAANLRALIQTFVSIRNFHSSLNEAPCSDLCELIATMLSRLFQDDPRFVITEDHRERMVAFISRFTSGCIVEDNDNDLPLWEDLDVAFQVLLTATTVASTQ